MLGMQRLEHSSGIVVALLELEVTFDEEVCCTGRVSVRVRVGVGGGCL